MIHYIVTLEGADRKIFMELSPKQQAVNEIKKAGSILIIGHKKPNADHLGSMLALKKALESLGKKIEIVVSGKIDRSFEFLPGGEKIEKTYHYNEEKILKINTKKIPIRGMKWQKEGDFLNIFLEAEKNLKFEFIEIENGKPKPDLIIILNTPDAETIDNIYEKNTELFYEVPIVNIDHHPGNEYFGSINLIDLTATSTSEILTSLLEALGIKIDDSDIATNLLAGIIYSTQSFRDQNTTPKSLTVAAQLLAAGGRQQEIISNLYKKKPVGLLRVWGEMLKNIKEDEALRFAWTKIDTTKDTEISKEDVFEVADNLLDGSSEAEVALVLFCGAERPDMVFGRLVSSRKKEVLSIASFFGGMGSAFDAQFSLKGVGLESAEKMVLKKVAESWGSETDLKRRKIWEIIEEGNGVGMPKKDLSQSLSLKIEDQKNIKTKAALQKEKTDAIEEALKSISQIEKDKERKELEHIGQVISEKRGGLRTIRNKETDEIDVFDED